MKILVRSLVATLILLIFCSCLLAGGHKYIAYPVIFVHGFNSDMEAWKKAKDNLDYLYVYKYGYTYQAINPDYFPDMNYGNPKRGEPFSGHGDCREIAVNNEAGKLGLGPVIYNAIGNAFYQSSHPHEPDFALVPENEQKVILVCHSFGGIVLRSLLKQNETINPKLVDIKNNPLLPNYFKSHIARVIFIDTPHAGSPLANALYMLQETKHEVDELHYLYYTHSIDIGYVHPDKKDDYYREINRFFNRFETSRWFTLSMAETLAGVDTQSNRPYDTSLKQLRLNQDVTLKLWVTDPFGIHRTLYEYTTPGNSTFLGQAASNLSIPNKYCVIYSDLDRDWLSLSFSLDPFCRLGGVIYNSMLNDYFIFPQGETLGDLVENGDAIVTIDSAKAIGGDLHLISDRSHVVETNYWEKIREVLLEDLLDMKIETSMAGNIYTTYLPLRGKIRNYLPLNCRIPVFLFNAMSGSLVYDYVIEHNVNNTDNDLDLNPNYEENNDDYQAIFSKRIPLFPNTDPVDNTPFELKLKPYDAAYKDGAEQILTFTYANFIYGTAPSDQSQEVTLDTPIVIYCQEKVRAETVNANTVRITPALAGAFTVQGKVITFTPSAPLQDTTHYTVTIKGDDPATYNVAYPTSTIEGVQYYLHDPAVGDSNADKHGWEPGSVQKTS